MIYLNNENELIQRQVAFSHLNCRSHECFHSEPMRTMLFPSLFSVSSAKNIRRVGATICISKKWQSWDTRPAGAGLKLRDLMCAGGGAKMPMDKINATQLAPSSATKLIHRRAAFFIHHPTSRQFITRRLCFDFCTEQIESAADSLTNIII